RHTRWPRDWSSDVCSSDLKAEVEGGDRESDQDDARQGPAESRDPERDEEPAVPVAEPEPERQRECDPDSERRERELCRLAGLAEDRKSTRLNSSHVAISYA